MTKDEEIYMDLIKVYNKIDLLKNPLYNDAGGSILWSEVFNHINKSIELLKKDKRIYGW